MKNRQIPDFFGDRISSREKWEASRDEIKSLFLEKEYGFLPCTLEYQTRKEDGPLNFAGKAVWERIFFDFTKGEKSHTVVTELILPKNKENVPVFFAVDFLEDCPNKYLPVEEIIDNGFGIFKVGYQNVTSDDGDFENGLAALFGEGDYGKIAVWSYMLRTMADYLDTVKVASHYAVIGHSRLGKTSLLTSALDDRFILACVNNSGCSGASLFRGKDDNAEKISDITRVFPFWFTKGFKDYSNNEENVPFDQHMLLSLVAPRYAIIGCAKEDHWADNEGAYISAELARPVWELYGKGENVSLYTREGTHFLSRNDWHEYMNKFNEILNINK